MKKKYMLIIGLLFYNHMLFNASDMIAENTAPEISMSNSDVLAPEDREPHDDDSAQETDELQEDILDESPRSKKIPLQELSKMPGGAFDTATVQVPLDSMTESDDSGDEKVASPYMNDQMMEEESENAARGPEAGRQQKDALEEHNYEYSQEHINIKEKRDDIVRLVQKAAAYLQDHAPEDAFSAFTHNKEFKQGEIYIFVYDHRGVCLAQGNEASLVWKNMYNTKDSYGAFFVQEMMRVSAKGPAWVSYSWRDSGKRSYVQSVEKNGQTYIVGAGYYPQSKEDAVINLVKGAVQHFNETVVQDKQPITNAFSTISYKLGTFVRGDLYLYALDFKGKIFAQGDVQGLVGQNAWDYKDKNGVYANREIIEKLKNSSHGIWQEYVSKNALKVTYAEKVQDNEGNFYFIACGYYPEANRKRVVELVKRGYHFLKRHGKTAAIEDFADKKSAKFFYGDLSLMVYDYAGNVISSGDNPDLQGTNMYNVQGENGKYYVQDLIKKAKSGGGWVNYKLHNSYKVSYVEPVNVGLEKYLITSGLYPISKKEGMMLMVKGAASLLASSTLEVAMQRIVDPKGSFIRGDLSVYVIDSRGIVLGWGDNPAIVWKNMMTAKDDEGRPFVRMLINAVKRGPAELVLKMNGRKQVVYAEEVKKDGKSYVVGSSYFV